MEGSRWASAPYELMGASLLAEQPITPDEQLPRPNDDWDTVFSHLESRLGMLRSWRYSWWAFWQVLARFFLPRRSVWLVTANRMDRGNALNDAIIDSTGGLAVRTCASGMWTGLTSPSRPWFKLANSLPWVPIDADGKAWLEDTQERVYTLLAGSNFYTQMAQAFQDVTVFGTAPVIIYEDDEDGIRLYLPCAGEYYLAVGARNSVDTLYREFNMTARAIVEMFRFKNCPHQVQTAFNTGGASWDLEFTVAHAIEPNVRLSARGTRGKTVDVLPGTFVYREIYWLKGTKTSGPLSKRGFRTKPFMAARWATTSNDAYGRSPCMDAIGDTKQIQQETRRKAEFIEKGVRPPMGANVELKNEPASIIPAQITYTSTEGGKKGFWPLFEVSAQWVAPLAADIKEVAGRIQECLFVNMFMAISRMEGVQPRNELELTKRDLERLQELGPFVQLFESEFAGPAIMRILDIMQRKQMLKPKPASLQNVPLKIDYISIMSLAQRSAESVSMKDVLATAGSLSSAAKAAGVPDPIRVINLDAAMRHYGDITNFKSDLFYSDDEVAKHDQIRTQEQQKAAAPGQAAAAVDAAKTLSQASLAPGNALSAMLPQGGGGPPA